MIGFSCYVGMLITGHFRIKFKKVDLDYSEYLGLDWKVKDNEKAPILISNHISFGDNFVMLMKYYPRFIARIGMKKFPIVGTFSDAINCLYIQRVGQNAGNSKI